MPINLDCLYTTQPAGKFDLRASLRKGAALPRGGRMGLDFSTGTVTRWSKTEPPETRLSFELPDGGNPSGIACAADGSGVWVTDTNNDMAWLMGPTGAMISSFGSPGSGDGEFQFPFSIAVNPVTGRIYIGDQGNGRVQYFDPDGSYLGQWGTQYVFTPAHTSFLWQQRHPTPHTILSPPGNEIDAPGLRMYCSLAYDEANQVTVLVAGCESPSSTTVPSTWLWDGTVWTDAAPAHDPGFTAPGFGGGTFTTRLPALCWDGNTGAVICLKKGSSGGEMWSWDGTDWTQLTPAHLPSDAYSPDWRPGRMAFDRTHNKVVYFGGVDSGMIGETWTWDGSDWTQESPAHSPAGATADLCPMTWDDTQGYVLMFGGGNVGAHGTSNETWSWNGTDWTKHTPITLPPARTGHLLAYAAGYGKTILSQGSNQIGLGNTGITDTWAWDGTNWTNLLQPGPVIPAVADIPRAWTYMVTDWDRDMLVTYGGHSVGAGVPPSWGDTWEIEYDFTPSSSTGFFGRVGWLAVDPADGSVYVGDIDRSIIYKFPDDGGGGTDGTPILSIGTVDVPGDGDGEIAYPAGLVVDGDGNLWALDSMLHVFSGRLMKFDSSGAWLLTYVDGTDDFADPGGIAIKPSTGTLYAIDNEGAFDSPVSGVWLADPASGFTSPPFLLPDPAGPQTVLADCFGPCLDVVGRLSTELIVSI